MNHSSYRPIRGQHASQMNQSGSVFHFYFQHGNPKYGGAGAAAVTALHYLPGRLSLMTSWRWCHTAAPGGRWSKDPVRCFWLGQSYKITWSTNRRSPGWRSPGCSTRWVPQYSDISAGRSHSDSYCERLKLFPVPSLDFDSNNISVLWSNSVIFTVKQLKLV